LGPRIFNLAVLDQDYPGWDGFRDETMRIFTILSENKVIQSITRVGMRYINFFPFNVFDVANFSISIEDVSLLNEKTLLREALAKVFSCGFVKADRFASRAKL